MSFVLPLQSFIARSLPVISAAWLNEVDQLKVTLLNNASTASEARTALQLDPQVSVRGVDTGAVNAAVVTITGVTTWTRVVGSKVTFTAITANTAAATLNVNGTGAAAVVNPVGNALTGGELSLPVTVLWNGAAWQIVSQNIPVRYARTANEISAAKVPNDYTVQPPNPLPVRFAAVGNGVANDTTPLRDAAAATPGVMLDGGGRTYLVSSVLPASPTAVGLNFYNGRITCSQTVSDTLDGYSVTIFGYNACAANTYIPEQHAAGGGIFYASGNHIVAIGRDALSLNTTGRRMTAVGSKALGSNTTGAYNTALGSHALQENTTGDENTAVGVQASQKITTGSFNTSCGVSAMLLQTTASNNAAFGHSALRDNLTGTRDVALGVQAMLSANGADDCVAIGYQSMSAALTGDFNTGVGSATLGALTSGTNNTAIGRRSLAAATTSSENTAIGADSCVALTTATKTVAVGFNTLSANQTGDNCTAVGHASLAACTGTNNTACGRAAGNAVTSGTGNTYVGQQAGASETTGTNNTAVGNTADSGVSGRTNCTTLGNGAASTGDNQFTMGNASIGTLRCQQTSITALSDKRFKHEIRPLEIPEGFILELQLIIFKWNMEKFAEDQRPGETGDLAGVLAQQLDELQIKYNLEWLKLVDKSNPDKWEATPGKLLLPLIVHTQKLTQRIAALEAKLA